MRELAVSIGTVAWPDSKLLTDKQYGEVFSMDYFSGLNQLWPK